MKIYPILLLALIIPACGKPDPYNAVRVLRRQYELKMDLTVNSEGVLTCEAKAKNLSGKKELQEITAIIKLMDADQKVLWSKQIEIDVSEVGNYATGTYAFKEDIGLTEFEFQVIELAPDAPDSDFMKYKEFMRVVPN